MLMNHIFSADAWSTGRGSPWKFYLSQAGSWLAFEQWISSIGSTCVTPDICICPSLNHSTDHWLWHELFAMEIKAEKHISVADSWNSLSKWGSLENFDEILRWHLCSMLMSLPPLTIVSQLSQRLGETELSLQSVSLCLAGVGRGTNTIYTHSDCRMSHWEYLAGNFRE